MQHSHLHWLQDELWNGPAMPVATRYCQLVRADSWRLFHPQPVPPNVHARDGVDCSNRRYPHLDM